MGGIFLDILITINPTAALDWWGGWPILIPITIWYHLSLKTLPPERARYQRRFLWLAYLYAVAFDLVSGLTPWIIADSSHGLGVQIKLFTLGPLYFLQPLSLIGLSLLLLYNFWQALQLAPTQSIRKQLDSIVRGSTLGVIGLVYGVLAIAFRVSAPTLPLVAGVGMAVVAVGYGIIRYSALAEGRVLRHDFVFSGALILFISLLYYLVLAALDVPVMVRVFTLCLVIISHSGYDFARNALDRLFLGRRELALRTALHDLSVQANLRDTLGEGLQNSLAAVAAAIDARWGLIALTEAEGAVVYATINSRATGERLPEMGLDVLELVNLSPVVKDRPLPDLAVIAPLVAERDSLGLILLGPPKGGSTYSERDLDLVAGAADDLAAMLRYIQQQEAHADEIERMMDSFQSREQALQAALATIQNPIDSKTTDSKRFGEVEDALRHLDDYSYLGDHPLTPTLVPQSNSRSTTHIDRGKALNSLLRAAVEKLRPLGEEPRDLAPRHWHPYVILRDAYVNGNANRDIMSRLYISEATFHRTRRRALRAVAKALFELTQIENTINSAAN